MSSERDRLNYLFRVHDVPHYYGDYVRGLFVAVAILSIISIPLLGDLLPFGTLAQVGGALLLVLLAGLTNPHSKLMMLSDLILSGITVLFLESFAITQYSIDSFALFAARETAAVLLLVAFYFSVKTFRAMSQGTLGKMERPWEFEEKDALK